MRKVCICTPNIWVTNNENLGFSHPVFWPYVIDCAPNLQQVLPPLHMINFKQQNEFAQFKEKLGQVKLQLQTKNKQCTQLKWT